MKEVWKDIVGYEGLYQVSNLGRVKSLERYVQNHGALQFHKEQIKRASERKRKDGNQGYLTLRLYKDNKGKNCYIHRLVAEAFIPNPENKPTVNHINGDKHDNRAKNLEWNTYKENNKHAYDTGLNGETHRRTMRVLQYDADMNLIAEYPSMREAERQTGIDCASISLGSQGLEVWRVYMEKNRIIVIKAPIKMQGAFLMQKKEVILIESKYSRNGIHG